MENQKGSFEAPFLSPKESFKGDGSKIEAWKEALSTASNILGFVYAEDRYYQILSFNLKTVDIATLFCSVSF